MKTGEAQERAHPGEAPPDAGPTRLHGGAERLPLRWIGAQSAESGGAVTCSWYRVAPGERCTRHVHAGKAETWLVVAGTAEVELGGVRYRAGAGDAFVAPPGTPHALTNSGAEAVVFVNVVERLAPVTTTTELEAGAP